MCVYWGRKPIVFFLNQQCFGSSEVQVIRTLFLQFCGKQTCLSCPRKFRKYVSWREICISNAQLFLCEFIQFVLFNFPEAVVAKQVFSFQDVLVVVKMTCLLTIAPAKTVSSVDMSLTGQRLFNILDQKNLSKGVTDNLKYVVDVTI